MSQPTASATPAAIPGRRARRVMVLGATGTIGRATARELLRRGHELVSSLREGADVARLPARATLHWRRRQTRRVREAGARPAAQAVRARGSGFLFRG